MNIVKDQKLILREILIIVSYENVHDKFLENSLDQRKNQITEIC